MIDKKSLNLKIVFVIVLLVIVLGLYFLKVPIKSIAPITVGSGPSGIVISGNYAYVADNGDGTFSVINISNPLLPKQIFITTFNNSFAGDSLNGLAISGNYAYVTNLANNSISI